MNNAVPPVSSDHIASGLSVESLSERRQAILQGYPLAIPVDHKNGSNEPYAGILFVDLIGSTSLASYIKLQQYFHIMEAFHKCAKRVSEIMRAAIVAPSSDLKLAGNKYLLPELKVEY